MTVPEHPDPRWWESLQDVTRPDPFDICYACPHCRAMHDAAGCRSPHAGLFNNSPCDCTNIPTGALFKDPRTLSGKGSP